MICVVVGYRARHLDPECKRLNITHMICEIHTGGAINDFFQTVFRPGTMSSFLEYSNKIACDDGLLKLTSNCLRLIFTCGVIQLESKSEADT